MTSNVRAEEVQAILDLMRPTPGSSPKPESVTARDFSRPRRLSPAQLEQVRKRAGEALPALAGELKALLRNAHEIEVEDVGEAHSEHALDELAAPFAVLQFHVRGQPCWVRWDTAPALAAIEVALGQGEAKPASARPLSLIEKTMFRRLAGAFAEHVARALQLEAKDLAVIDDLEDVQSWREGGERADPQRVALHLSFDGPGGASSVRVYLPDLGLRGDGAKSAPAKLALPEHLREVDLEIAARLGSTEIPLSELLHLEVGDVIPLGAEGDGTLRLYVEDRPCASASLGQKHGSLAVRIHQPFARAEED